MHKLKKIEAKKSLGQHFLTSPVVPGWMCDAAALVAGDTVLEIGPGTGVLTREILARGANVIALEADARAIAALEETFREEIVEGRLTIIHSDVRTLDLAALPEITDHEYTVVANIPYYLSGFLFRTILESSAQPKRLVFLVQREVAKRVVGDVHTGGKESLLSLSVKAYGVPSYVKTVSRGHFAPAPKVDSAIVCVEEISRNRFTDVDPVFFFHILRLGFGQKRKQLLGNLAKEFEREELIHIFSTQGIPVPTRAEDLPLETWLALARNLSIHRE
jgi:16S rRNA (adenine1518-N6/adenine1519-N6)-dimethyltransferase